MELRTQKGADFARVAVALDQVIDTFNTDSATVVALSGDLGAGKTTLVQYLARVYGVEEVIQSPTFVIMKRYVLHDMQYLNLIHIDAYRIEKEEEMQTLGLHRLVADPKNLILIEWPEKISGLLPENRITVSIEHDGEGRKVKIVTSV